METPTKNIIVSSPAMISVLDKQISAKSMPAKTPKEKVKRVQSSPRPRPSPASKKPKVSNPSPISAGSISPSSKSPKRRLSIEEPSPEPEVHDIVIKPPPLKRTKVDAAGNHSSTCDPYCWVCHKEGTTLDCQVCPRAFHAKCESTASIASAVPLHNLSAEWICPECRVAMAAENVDTRSVAMSMLSIEQLCSLLKFSLNRLKKQSCEAFHRPVSIEEYPSYLDYVIHPVDISSLEKNIKQKLYGSTEAFVSDVKWMYHNSVIFNGSSHRLTSFVRNMVKVCKAEMKEIETCPDCYLHAHTLKEGWFVEPCRKPHVLVWAKLKGFPYWPGKVVKVENGNADVRFFGAHDKAWVPVHLCFLLSYNTPQPIKIKKKANFDQSLEELDAHIQKLKQKLGGFEYALPKMALDPEKIYLQPISKVTTGRRYSDAEASSRVPKARTFTVVTSSWTRKQQAEGFTKQKKEPKDESSATTTPPVPAPSRMTATIKSEPQEPSNEELEKQFTMFADPPTAVKKNPPPKGVFEISDGSLEMPQNIEKPLYRSSKLAINKYQNMSWKSLIDRISERIDNQVPKESAETQISVTYLDDESAESEAEENETKSENDESGSKTKVEKNEVPVEKLFKERKVSEEAQLEASAAKEDVSSFKCSSPLMFKTPKSNETTVSYLPKLEETIKQCKAQLGIVGSVSEEITFETSEDEDEDEEDEEEMDDSIENKEMSVEVDKKTDEKDSEEVKEDVNGEDSNKSFQGDVSIISESEPVKATAEVCNGLEETNDKPEQNETESSQKTESRSTSKEISDETLNEDLSNQNRYSHKLLGFVEELSKDSDHPNNQQATIRSLELEIERLLWMHKQELLEVKHNSDLVLLEVRASLEMERHRAIAELQDKFAKELAEQKRILVEEKRKAIEAERKWLKSGNPPARNSFLFS